METFFTYGITVTPSDTVNIDESDFYALTCTTAGAASILTSTGKTVVVSLAVGVLLRGIGFKRVNSTGTTALGIVAWK